MGVVLAKENRGRATGFRGLLPACAYFTVRDPDDFEATTRRLIR